MGDLARTGADDRCLAGHGFGEHAAELLFHGAVADKDHAAVMRQLRQGRYQQIEPLVVFEAPHEAKRKGVSGSARLAWLGALVDIGVKAELRDDRDWPAVALALQDFCPIAVASKRGTGA